MPGANCFPDVVSRKFKAARQACLDHPLDKLRGGSNVPEFFLERRVKQNFVAKLFQI
jgi:hypothetical protein